MLGNEVRQSKRIPYANPISSVRMGCIVFSVFSVLVPTSLWFLEFFFVPYRTAVEIERNALAGKPVYQLAMSRWYSGFTGEYTMLYRGRFAPDKRKALYWMEIAKNDSDLSACCELPRLYEKDFPGTRNKDVVNWYIEASNKSDAQDAARLSEIYAVGKLDQTRNLEKAQYWRTISQKNKKIDETIKESKK